MALSANAKLSKIDNDATARSPRSRCPMRVLGKRLGAWMRTAMNRLTTLNSPRSRKNQPPHGMHFARSVDQPDQRPNMERRRMRQTGENKPRRAINKHASTVAVLVDLENMGTSCIEEIMHAARSMGVIATARAYGGVGLLSSKHFVSASKRWGIEPVICQAFSTGKNSADIRLVVDAMDLLARNTVDSFALASSDSDYAALIRRILLDGKTVHAFVQPNANPSFCALCSSCTTVESVSNTEEQSPGSAVRKTPSHPKSPEQKRLWDAISDAKKRGILITDPSYIGSGLWFSLSGCPPKKAPAFTRMVAAVEGNIRSNNSQPLDVLVLGPGCSPKRVAYAARRGALVASIDVLAQAARMPIPA